uniref:Uncharacterized protein n=1 Tax=Rhodnius prolixus TaxID=13249 RepID=T1HZP7_RHOPR
MGPGKLIVINDKLFPRPEMHEAYEMMRDGEKKEYEEVKKEAAMKRKDKVEYQITLVGLCALIENELFKES